MITTSRFIRECQDTLAHVGLALEDVYTVTEDGERDRCGTRKFSQLDAMNSTGNLLKAGFRTLSWRRVNGVASPAGPADKVASGRAGSWKD